MAALPQPQNQPYSQSPNILELVLRDRWTDLDDVTVLKGESIQTHTCTLRQTSQRNPVQSQPPTVLVLIEDSASSGFHTQQ